MAPCLGGVGDSCDRALAESIIGLVTAAVIRRGGPWRGGEGVEFTALEWVDWFHHRRLPEPVGCAPPAEAGASHPTAQGNLALAA